MTYTLLVPEIATFGDWYGALVDSLMVLPKLVFVAPDAYCASGGAKGIKLEVPATKISEKIMAAAVNSFRIFFDPI